MLVRDAFTASLRTIKELMKKWDSLRPSCSQSSLQGHNLQARSYNRQKPIATKTKSNNKESKGKEIQVNAAAVDNGDGDSD